MGLYIGILIYCQKKVDLLDYKASNELSLIIYYYECANVKYNNTNRWDQLYLEMYNYQYQMIN